MRYNLCKVLACSTTFFQLSLLCTTFFQLHTFMLFISSKSSSSQGVLGLSFDLLDVGFHLLVFCIILYSTRYLCPILTKLELSRQIFKNTQISMNFMKICPVAAELFLADRRKDSQTFAFRNFTNVPNSEFFPTTMVEHTKHVEAVGCRTLIDRFFLGVLLIPSGGIQICIGVIAPTCTPLATGLNYGRIVVQIVSYRLLTADARIQSRADDMQSVSSWPRQQTPTELEWQIPTACTQCWDTPDDGQCTCPKYIEYFII